MFGILLVVLAACVGALYYLFQSYWIIALGLAAGAALVIAFGYIDALDGAQLAKTSLDQDERGWRRFDRRAA